MDARAAAGCVSLSGNWRLRRHLCGCTEHKHARSDTLKSKWLQKAGSFKTYVSWKYACNFLIMFCQANTEITASLILQGLETKQSCKGSKENKCKFNFSAEYSKRTAEN